MLMKAVMPKKFQLNVIPDFRTFLFPDGGEIHYIGGSDILPAPLEADDEARAIGYLGSAHDEEARKLLIEHNLRLVVYIAKKFDNTGIGVEDLISITQINLSVSFYCIFNGISGLGKCRRIKNYNIKFLTFLFQLREQFKNILANKFHIVG